MKHVTMMVIANACQTLMDNSVESVQKVFMGTLVVGVSIRKVFIDLLFFVPTKNTFKHVDVI